MKSVVFAAAVVAAAMAVPAGAAGWHVQSIPGASCSTDSRTTGSWEYRGPRLLNTDTDPWGIAVAVCPVSVFAPGMEPREYRVILKDPAEGDLWCRLYSGSGTLVRQQLANWDASVPIWGSFPLSGVAATGYVEMTLHCLLTSGASLDEIELVWWKP
jgi:hypothetical protein